jgi:phytoene dehydrogenase-like protein
LKYCKNRWSIICIRVQLLSFQFRVYSPTTDYPHLNRKILQKIMDQSKKKKVLIIGAGIAGMSAGCYLQMNGYDTEIFESNSMSGGLCTSWKRKGYTFDPCTHWLIGTKKTSEFYPIWMELGVLRNTIIYNHNKFKTAWSINGREFSLFADIDLFEQEMLRFAPEDKRIIKNYCAAIREVKKIRLPIYKARENFGILDYLSFPFKNWRLVRLVSRWRNVTIENFANRFRNEELKQLFLGFFTGHEDFSIIAQFFTLSWFSRQEAGRPAGGSHTVSTNLQQRYESLGGKIRFQSPVKEIRIENKNANGLILDNGKTVSGDYIISAADMHCTITNLLKTGDKSIFKAYFDKNIPFPSFIDVNLGIDTTLDLDLPHRICYDTDKEVALGNGLSSKNIVSHIFNFDKSTAPEGKSVIMTHLRCGEFDYWQKLYNENPTAYAAEKKRIADEIIDIVDKKFSTEQVRIREHIEVIDVTTPVSYYRWTGNYRGSYEGWIPTPKLIGNSLKRNVPGINNFFMAGHWIEPGGGIPAAAISGRKVAQIICKKDARKFKTIKVSETVE